MARIPRWATAAAVGIGVVAAVAAVLWWQGARGGLSSSASETVFVTVAPTSSGSPAPRVASAPTPVVRGDQLVDSRTGDVFIPRGLNWSSFEYACTQGWGYSALDPLGDGAVDKVAQAIADWGVNTVRLPLNEDCWLGTRGAPVSGPNATLTAQGYRDEIQRFVTALNVRGVVVVLDLQSRKRLDADNFGNVAMPDTDSLEFWRQVAAQYAGDGSVMFDAFNEPYSRPGTGGASGFTLTWECWRDGGCLAPVPDDQSALTGKTYLTVGMNQVVAAIRGAGARQPIWLGGLDYSNDLSKWLQYAPADDQLVASFHSYDFKPCATAACWDQVLAPIAQKVPLVAGEVGANRPLGGYVQAFSAWARAHGVGTLYWDWGNDPHDAMALTEDQYGAPSAYGRLVRGLLTQR